MERVVPDVGAEGFAALYRAEYPGAVRLAWLLTHDAALAEDVAQDAFAALYRQGVAVERPAAYLRTAVVNGCRERHRRGERQGRRLRLVRPRPDEPHLDAEVGGVAHSLARLPERQRAAIVLRYWCDLPEAEIAAVLGVRPTTVRTLVARGLAALREEMEP